MSTFHACNPIDWSEPEHAVKVGELLQYSDGGFKNVLVIYLGHDRGNRYKVLVLHRGTVLRTHKFLLSYPE